MQFTTKSGKIFEIKEFKTRKIDREYQEIISEGMKITASGEVSDINPNNVQKANDYLVGAMTGVTQAEIDELTSDEFNEILAKINGNEAKNA